MIRRIHFVVEWRVAGCIQSRREMRTWMRTTHNKYTRVPTVARWKMGFRKARFRSYEQVRGRSDDKASFRFIQTGPRTIARLRRTESRKMRKRVDPTFLIFSYGHVLTVRFISRNKNYQISETGKTLVFFSGQETFSHIFIPEFHWDDDYKYELL